MTEEAWNRIQNRGTKYYHVILLFDHVPGFGGFQTSIGWGFCDIQNNEGQGRGYPPKPNHHPSRKGRMSCSSRYSNTFPAIAVAFSISQKSVTWW